MSKVLAQGNYLILEKVDYEKEETTEGGIIVKMSQVLDSSFAESKILSIGQGIPDSDGNVPPVNYNVGDSVLYDGRSRIGIHADFDVILREHVVAVVYDETD
jgi:co-chaperonin GroES (HSP10)|tara:strand:- start:4163 stop:4468 length:306 start_codon:yes stop_codon:yes gene_type:complete